MTQNGHRINYFVIVEKLNELLLYRRCLRSALQNENIFGKALCGFDAFRASPVVFNNSLQKYTRSILFQESYTIFILS